MKIDLTQTHDVLGAYQATDFNNVRERYQDAGTNIALMFWMASILPDIKLS